MAKISPVVCHDSHVLTVAVAVAAVLPSKVYNFAINGMLNNKCKLLVALLCVSKMQRRFVGAFAPQCFASAWKRTTSPTLYPSVRWMASETGERTEEEQEAIKAAREAKK